MNRSPHHPTGASRGFVLLGVMVPLFALLIITSSLALLVGHRWQETRAALDQGTMEEDLDAALWALRYYYHNTAVAATAPLDNQATSSIIASSLTTLGYTGGGAGVWATKVSKDNPAGIQLRITPVSLTNPSTPMKLTQTGTYLDGRQVIQGTFSILIEFQSSASSATLQQTRTLIFCQIPSDALALSGLADLQNVSGNLASYSVGGTTFVRGHLDAEVPFDFSNQNALMAGSYGTQVSRNGQSLNALSQETDYRYQTEIAGSRIDLTQNSTDLRTSTAQRAAALRSPIPSQVMVREGLAADPSLTVEQAQLYRQNQPFYQVPMGNRYWLSHNPNTGILTPAASEFNEPAYSAGMLPPVGGWVVSIGTKLVAGTNQVVVVIDPTLAPSPLFLGSINQGNYGDYSNLIVELKAAPTLPSDFQLISPNTIVINGDLNADNAHHLNLVGGQVFFGYTTFTQLTFTGSMASLSGASQSPWRNANGSEHAIAQISLQDSSSTSSPISYYVTLLQRQN